MIIFSEANGRVARIKGDAHTQLGTISFKELDLYESLRVMIDGHAVAFKPTYQISDTLGDDLLLMTFGETVSPVTIKGIVFDGICDTEKSGARSGVPALIQWWNKNNLSKRVSSITFQLSSPTLAGQSPNVEPMNAFVADMEISVDDPSERLWRFRMTLLRIPARVASRDSEFLSVAAPPTFAPGIPTPLLDAFIGQLPNFEPPPPTPLLDTFIDQLPTFLPSPQSPVGDGFDSASTPVVGTISGT